MATSSNATSTSEISVLKSKKILQFPSDLGSTMKDRYGNDVQYMMIRIISDEKGSTLRNDTSLGQAYEPTNTGSGIGIETTVTSPTTSAATDPDLVRLHGNSTTSTTMVAKKGKVKLDKVIVLPMPNSFDVPTSIAYTPNFDPGLLTKAADIWNDVGKGAAGELVTLAKNKGLSSVLNKLKSGATDTQRLLAEEGLALNPKNEVMFDNIPFRQFNFRYTLAPKNATEAAIVNEIIETLRYYALPEITPGKMFYILPAEFQIEFMIGSKINQHIPRIATSFLQSVAVNYSPANVWASLPNGSPVALDLSISLIENEIIDRNRIYSTNTDGTTKITSGY